ncbi:MAG: Crp/Fnr family transcriptional regulator [Saprospiraceae bacterium]|nr:Crp/Fnr family transcriptional regulator [Bacteroidia bacterium]NNE16087.1 Crp/Fnr family transcriptional regulator [Saprospiraceae bacterium]NNL91300.1 Crp/Fnr family transcriptional regulator [Saprospiraceae bacterium]
MDISTKMTYLGEVSLFEDLAENELVELAELTSVKDYSKHQIIYRVDDPAESVHILVNGVVKIVSKSHEGREVIKTIIHPKSLFGFEYLSLNGIRSNTAKSVDKNVICLQIRSEDMKNYLKNNWDLTQKFMRMLGTRLMYVERRFESLVFKDARERIIDFLKDNARINGRQVGLEMLVKHSLTQQDIANFTGTSRQTVTYVLNDLKRQNQIYFKRKSILIRDIASLC